MLLIQFSNTLRVSNSLGSVGPGPEVIKLFSCSTQLSTKFQLLMKTKILKNKEVSNGLSLLDVVFIMLINVKMSTIVGILTFYEQAKLRAQMS